MSNANAPANSDDSLPAGNTDSSPSTPAVQCSPEHPWLIRAGYFLRGNEMKTITLPGAEGLSPQSPVYFSRLFLSKWLGGSQQPAYTNVKFDPNHNRVYLLEAYYVGIREWNPQYPKRPGENGALLLAGKSFEKPPVPWPTTTGCFLPDHRAMFTPYNCFVRRSSAEYEYIGRYLFHAEFRKSTKEEVEKNVPKATRDLWTSSIDTSRWGAQLKGKSESRKAEELFNLPDDDPCRLCFYWEYMEYIGYDQGLYNALRVKGEEIGWTTRKPTALRGRRGLKTR